MGTQPSERLAVVASEPDPQAASTGAVASGSRAAGIVFSLGYLLGFVPGPIVAVVGGLALITFGRSLLLDRRSAAYAAAAVAVVAASLGVGALRWSTLSLDELRGVQEVLGPTLSVGPARVASASSIAAGAALLAVSVWSALGPRLDRNDRVWLTLEALVAALTVVTVFASPLRLLGDEAPAQVIELALWAGATVVTGAVVIALDALIRKGPIMRRMAMALSSVAAVVAAVIMVISL